MFRCDVCGPTEKKESFVDEMFRIDGKPVMVEHNPAVICIRCGEETFSREISGLTPWKKPRRKYMNFIKVL